jgi:nitrile hydratase
MTPRFKPGEPVRVAERATAGHVRTPRYIRGKRGVVERICGEFRNPEELAYGRYDGERRPLYRVRFAQREVWPDYAGAPDDTVDVEIYEHWLEHAEGKR